MFDIDIDVAYVDIVWHKIKICKPEGQKLRILLKSRFMLQMRKKLPLIFFSLTIWRLRN